ncbi:MAG: DNA polymerase III subunit alpha [Mesorhizobium sp.]|uniref:error-prone DNA polymerase n=1 Tax=unclassified Mesorhizobium TaxID=325217 RepID=UPI000FD3E175|nr:MULTISPECIES: error-prone DNA polymerase [unclassified Mesorhizobium]RUV28816.1 DNA polymerase III subunit alpha [Mesorhizobium sp. M5C.F.Ca.IN.020.32.2.1]RWG41064.1 MAG: DNA polymerase III subunit alpha [Mesorhizobium sp.]RWH50055.1 MAG: DNA polymerase III subunit alpha [Mesorhizobium sp.]RWI67814.1 MAG: DNA polymerase III subunit alpha [Mesorhizobium sp.]RWI77769.1 MAG: DNA polymerase III subunit alpha [Mesorhizobium sp.]
MTSPRYAELQVTSHFSFLRGASSAEELFAQAALLGIEALAVVDRNSLAGIVRAHEAAKTTGVRLVVGCRLDLADGMSVLVYPTDRAAYARLCRLLTLGKGRAGKGKCHLEWVDLLAYGEGLITVLVPDAADETCGMRLRRLREGFGDRAYMALTLRRRPNDQLRLHNLSNIGAKMHVPTVVTNDVLFHESGRRILQDVVTCIRHNVTIDELGDRRERHADRCLKPPEEMHRLFGRYPEALARTLGIVARCRFSLDELAYQYPEERDDPALTPQQTLEKLTWDGAAQRYPDGLPDSVRATLDHELQLIQKLGYAPYFLTVNSIVRFARSRDILCQGRGSAANSAVCFVLGITSIDPGRNDLLFERFVSEERREPPDIDVDFEHERREIVMQWVFDTYGRDHAALCSTVIRYRTKGALRDVGKALGLPEDLIRTLSGQVWGWSEEGVADRHLAELNLNLSDRRLRLALDLARQLMGAPRHLSQHPGGFVLTHDRLDDLVPIEPAAMVDRQVIEWDKDDIDALKFMKVDVLALGMLTCMKKGLDLLAEHKDIKLDLATIPAEDPRTYAMIRKADTLGTFQIESRAQMSMLPRLKPRTYYDLVVQVAIVRPGPIQGDMVHPYLRRREGLEPVHYPKPELERVLGKTLGVPLFQEQAMRVAIECAGFTPGEADMLRKSMATFKHTGGVSAFKTKLIEGMVDRGYDRPFAEKTFSQLEGFGSYGFPESHAASFALIAYASAWLKCWHPDVFCCALLNSQPMGFYAPAQIVRDAIAHGVEVRPPCVNASRWDCALESTGDESRFAVRLGLRMVRGLANVHAGSIIASRADQPFASVDDLWRRAGVPQTTLVQLAEADAFRPSLGLARREALWAIKALRDEPLPLFAATAREHDAVPEIVEPAVVLRTMTAGAEVVEDCGHVGLSLRNHPVSFLRDDLRRRRIVSCAEAMDIRDGGWLEAAGIVLVRQRPGSAKGVMFITLEDETGIANLVVWPKVFEANRRTILSASMIAVRGRVQREGEVVHLVARHLTDLSAELASVGQRDTAFPLPHGRGDEFHHGSPTPDPRGLPLKPFRGRNLVDPYSHISEIKVKTRDFH